MELTEQDHKNLRVFLDRVDLKGAEAMAMAEVQMKLKNMLNQLLQPTPAPKPTPIDQGKKEA